MLFGYLVTYIHPQLHDVPTHVLADVCSRTIFHLFYHRSVARLSAIIAASLSIFSFAAYFAVFKPGIP